MFFCSILGKNDAFISVKDNFLGRFYIFDFLLGGTSCESCLV